MMRTRSGKDTVVFDSQDVRNESLATTIAEEDHFSNDSRESNEVRLVLRDKERRVKEPDKFD